MNKKTITNNKPPKLYKTFLNLISAAFQLSPPAAFVLGRIDCANSLTVLRAR